MALYRSLIAMMLIAASTYAARAQGPDSVLTQDWKSASYGYGFRLPAKARFNQLGSSENKAGSYELTNFILPGGCGSISISHLKERRMVPQDYKLTADSIHYYASDSTGRNGIIHRCVFILTQECIQIDILLTPKGDTEYASLINPVFATFSAPPGAERVLPKWRYGRDPKEYEHDEYQHGVPTNR